MTKSVDQQTALVAYVSMGPTRSLQRVADELGYNYHSLKRWSAKHDWATQAAAADSHRANLQAEQVEVLSRVHDSTLEMNERHVALGRELQDLAQKWAERLASEDRPRSPGDVVKWIEAGVRIERLATAHASQPDWVTRWNTFIEPILVAFRDVVMPHLDPEYRDQVTRDFASLVNSVRDSVVEASDGD